jgi:aconitate hydratase
MNTISLPSSLYAPGKPHALSTIEVQGQHLIHVDLKAGFGPALRKLPVVLRLLLENAVRNMVGAERDAAVRNLLNWLTHQTSESEIAFQPGRVLMHDTTSTPALVDIAAMRNALAEAGADPSVLNPGLPVDVCVDHSLAVEVYAKPDAATINLGHELRRNAERYRFLRWAAKALDNVRIHPPGTGIMHTINLEQLATVVTTENRQGQLWAVPDMMIGTDSHTPMINGIGVLGWGVGGLEAQTVMFGMPTMLRIPEVIGVKLRGALAPGVLATDLALVVTQQLRAIGVSGEFVEFYGPGVTTLSAGQRCVVANMAPEYGATTGYFPVDAQTLVYLKATGRSEAHLQFVEAYLQATGLWFNPEDEPLYTRSIAIDLSTIGMHIAGPQRPQDLLDYGDSQRVLRAINFQAPASEHSFAPPAGDRLPRYPIALAAITSCTNTSDPSLLIAAGLLARKARSLGLRVPSWVKTSLAPGSPASASFLKRAGLIDDLAAVGFDIVGYGCTTCIGNAGPLPDLIKSQLSQGMIRPVAAISGNRNFPGRVHPDLDLGFLMSPPLVIAFALAGDAERNLRDEPVQTLTTGQAVYLRDLWPNAEELEECIRMAVKAEDFQQDFKQASLSPLWHKLAAPDGPLFAWDAKSTALRRPPFASLSEKSLLGMYTAYPLMVLGDDITTDHISPASAIPQDSLVADFLVARGDDRADLNVFASRRGNWEVMMRGAFHSKSLVNLLTPSIPLAHTVHSPDGDIQPIWEVAARYQQAGLAVVIVAGERYGTGSSRDWAAKGQRLLGVRAVLAMSFERIHRSNLIGMGILPLCLPEGKHPQVLQLMPGDKISVDASPEMLSLRGAVNVSVIRVSGQEESFMASAAIETQLELALLKAGGVIPMILRNNIDALSKPPATLNPSVAL